VAVVEVKNVSKTFGTKKASRFGRNRGPGEVVHALRDVSFTVERGETLALVGESGSGKSTLGRITLRLIEADEGTVTVLGRSTRDLDRKELRAARQHMQMIFQDPFSSLDQRMVIGDLIAEPMIVHGIEPNAEARRRRVAELIDRVGLSVRYLDRFPYEFSGGQLQRVAIARALATDPQFVVCDEPVAALDVSIRAQVLNLLMELQRERGLSYLFISHDLSLVRVLADRVAVIQHGVIVEHGLTDDIYDRPTHAYTKALLSAVPGRDPERRKLLTKAPTVSDQELDEVPGIAVAT
jgi:ABC-type oligopeptide transport system ATPase subunit